MEQDYLEYLVSELEFSTTGNDFVSSFVELAKTYYTEKNNKEMLKRLKRLSKFIGF